MKNKTFFGILTGIIAMGGILAVLQFTPDSASANLSEDEAKEKVTNQFPGDIVEFELEEKGNKTIYEIDIEGTDRHYDLEIDAETGEILELEEKELTPSKTTKQEQDTKQTDKVNEKTKKEDNETKTKSEKQSNKSNNTLISYDEAKSIALSEYDGHITELELDDEDGQKYYEIEIETDNAEIELEINAYTGEIIYISKDDLDD